MALLKVSGNPINGLGESAPRRPSPFFWHPPDQHPYGELQTVARLNSRKCPGSQEAFLAAYDRPELIPVAASRAVSSPEEFTSAAIAFARSHEADDIGIAPMDPLYVFEGYAIDVCSWTRPNVRPKLLATMARRLGQVEREGEGDSGR
jgi:epoxyqueuosine reductase